MIFLPSLTRKKSSPAPVETTATTVLKDLDNLETIPTLSDTVAKAMAIAKNRDASIVDFTEIIARDSALAVAVLKLSNSVVYYSGKPITEVRQAVVRIGLEESSNIVAAVGMRGMLKGLSAEIRETCEDLLRHSLFTAKLAARLNRMLVLGYKGEEFTAALLHDIGRVIIAIKAPLPLVQYGIDLVEDATLLGREKNIYGIDHCAVGSFFVIKNELPEAIHHTILHHHSPEAAPDHRKLISLVGFADALAEFVEENEDLAEFDPFEARGYGLLSAKWNDSQHETFQKVLKQAVLPAIRDTKAMMQSTGRA